MKRLGLDFGTTNSTLSYLEPGSKEIKSFRMQGAGSSDYIPSCIAFNKDDHSILIGIAARLKRANTKYEVKSGFKMLLGESDKETLSKYQFDDIPPEKCTKEYLSHLLEAYCKENKVDKIDRLVISVPHIWIREGDHLAREMLKKICDELGVSSVRILSEPDAASAYFTYCYQKKNGGWYKGHALVCDYGGGTLDLSLVEIEGQRIKVLECTGKGRGTSTLGRAGLAFDEAVVKKVYEGVHGVLPSRSNPEYYELLKDFEEQKIAFKEQIDEALEDYKIRKNADRSVISVGELEFMSSHLVDVFEEVIKPDLTGALTEMHDYLEKHHIDYSDGSAFRVLMVGGFSNFYLVEKTIRDFFKSKQSGDKRFDSCFTLVDTALAISKGNALVANDLIDIDLICPIEVGFRASMIQMDQDRKTDITVPEDYSILKKGKKISEYSSPCFYELPFDLGFKNVKDDSLIIYLSDGEKKHHVKIEVDWDKIFPNSHLPGRKWEVGFSVDENLLFKLHIREFGAEKPEEHCINLGNIIKRVSGLVLSK